MNDRIERALALLPGLLFQDDGYGARSLLEELYDGAQDDLLTDLCSAAQAAAIWGVSDRRARAHLARLHDKYGIGRQLSDGTWLVRRAHVEAHPPDARYRRKESN